jgi:hypothetical protein
MIGKNLTRFGKVPLGKVFKLIPGVTYQFHLPEEDVTKFTYHKEGEDSAEILRADGISTGIIRMFNSDVPVRLVD